MKFNGILPSIACLLFLVQGCSREDGVTTKSPEALRAYNEGMAQWEKFYYREAKASFDEALKNDSSFAMAWMRMGLVKAETARESDALVCMETAERFSRGATDREQLLIRMWHHRVRYEFEKAAEVADSLMSMFPREPEGYLVRGYIHELNKNLDAAIRSYQKAADVDTGFARPVMLLGYAYSLLGEHEKAVGYMERYIRMAPDAADPRASLADLLVRIGRYDEALDQYRKSLELKPDYWYAVQEIGHIYRILGRLREAEQQYRRSLELLPPGRQVDANRLVVPALLDIARGEYSLALEQYNEALRIDTTAGEAAYGRVFTLGKLKRFSEAQATLAAIGRELKRRNLTNTPSMLAYYLAVSRLSMQQGHLDAAIAACDSALEFSVPLTRASVSRQVAEVLLRQRQYEQALDACEDALRLNSNSPDVLLTLMRIYHARRDVEMTREIGGRLLDLWKDADPDFQYRREVLALLGKRRPV